MDYIGMIFTLGCLCRETILFVKVGGTERIKDECAEAL